MFQIHLEFTFVCMCVYGVRVQFTIFHMETNCASTIFEKYFFSLIQMSVLLYIKCLYIGGFVLELYLVLPTALIPMVL